MLIFLLHDANEYHQMKRTYFKLFSRNILVWGKPYSAIYDLQQQVVHRIPNVVHDVIRELDSQSLEAYKSSHSLMVVELVEKQLLLLADKGLGFFCADPELYPSMDLSWQSSSVIETAVLEYDRAGYAMAGAAMQLNELLCKYLELRMPVNMRKRDLQCLQYFENTTLRSINLVLHYHPDLDPDFLKVCFRSYRKIKSIIVLDAPVDSRMLINKNESIYYFKTTVPDPHSLSQGKVRQHIINQQFFMESLLFNPYYNRKIVIDRFGNLKNDLGHERHFGNINHISITDTLANTALTTLWSASADKIVEHCQSAMRYAMLITEDLIPLDNGLYRIAG